MQQGGLGDFVSAQVFLRENQGFSDCLFFTKRRHLDRHYFPAALVEGVAVGIRCLYEAKREMLNDLMSASALILRMVRG